MTFDGFGASTFISDGGFGGGTGGSLAKIGSGTLTLSGTNTRCSLGWNAMTLFGCRRNHPLGSAQRGVDLVL